MNDMVKQYRKRILFNLDGLSVIDYDHSGELLFFWVLDRETKEKWVMQFNKRNGRVFQHGKRR